MPSSRCTPEHAAGAPSYGAEAADALGLSPDEVFKTLVARVDGALVTAVVPVSGNLDLKALAAAAGGKKAVMAEPTDAERATGYVVGGISRWGSAARCPASSTTRCWRWTRCTCRPAGAGCRWGSPRPTWCGSAVLGRRRSVGRADGDVGLGAVARTVLGRRNSSAAGGG